MVFPSYAVLCSDVSIVKRGTYLDVGVQKTWIKTLAQLPSSYVTSGKLFNLSNAHFAS